MRRLPVDSGAAGNRWVAVANVGGAGRDRTDDPLLAKQVLSQLSYGPVCFRDALNAGHLCGRLTGNCAVFSL